MGLSFLSPLLLGGAALVIVPIVLHLIMQRKPVPHEFPALRFLRERAVATRRRLRLSHILLLLLRIAALALLAMALSRPVLRGAGWLAGREGPVAAVFVFDTAPRMLLREANRTRLEQAKAMAQVLFAKLPTGSRVAVLDTSGGPTAFSPTEAAAAVRIGNLAAATPVESLAGAIAGGLRLLESPELVEFKRREVYVFTDCSAGAWDNAAPLDIERSHPGTAALYVDVSAAAAQNFALETVDLSGDQLPAGTPLAITVTTRRSGPAAARAVAVELLTADGQYARRAVKPVDWKPEADGQVDFEVAGLEPGLRQGRVVVDGADDLDADNVRFFSVEVGAPPRVIVAAPAPSARTGQFMLQAIAPLGLRRAGKVRFDASLIDVTALEGTAWDSVRAIVLVDPPPLAPRTWELLGQWVAGGGGLVVWLGPRAGDPARFNSAAAREVLGGGIVRVWRSADGGNYIAPSTLDHPILAAFRRIGDEVPWQDFPVRRHWEFEAGAAAEAGGAIPVATYRNGLPAVLEHRLGKGGVVIVTTPVSQPADDPEAWNTLATGFEPWPFVMLANEALLHAIDNAEDRNVITGTPAVLQLDRRDIAAAVVRTPGGDDFPAAVDQRRGTITVTATQVPGNYLVRAGGAAGGFSKGFSANLLPAATDYRRLPPDALATVLGAGHRLARTETELVRDVNLERIGAELFGWLILLVALVMAADWIVANRFYSPREGGAVGRPATAFTGDASRGAAPPPVPHPSAPESAEPTPTPPPVPPMAPTAGAGA